MSFLKLSPVARIVPLPAERREAGHDQELASSRCTEILHLFLLGPTVLFGPTENVLGQQLK